MTDSSDISRLVGQFWTLGPVHEVESLGSAGGFSGARFWRIRLQDAEYCLRRWPTEHPSAERLVWLHHLLRTAERRGIDFVPVPLETSVGATFVSHADHLWELAPWLPGEADFHLHPSDLRIRNAFAALAQLHVAILDSDPASDSVAVAPAVTARCQRFEQLHRRGLENIRRRIHIDDWPELAPRAIRIVERAADKAAMLRDQLQPFENLPVRLQPVLRDVWHDHVLFTGDRVTGLVDFGAMRIDTVTTDVARLLGSLVGDDRPARKTALTAYEAVRPLTPDEAALVAPLDRSGTLIGSLNWLDWIYCEERQFENREAILIRLDALLVRMDAW